MRLLDRYIIKAFLINYVLAFGVLVGMVTLFDLVVNFRSFTQTSLASTTSQMIRPSSGAAATTRTAATSPAPEPEGTSVLGVIGDIIDYYSYQTLVIFQQIAGIIPLMAAGFTMVRMTRHRELTAMLASGVSLYRVAAPIIIVAMIMAGLGVLNQEFLISQPFIIQKLQRKHGEPNEAKVRPDAITFVVDRDNSLLSAREFDAKNGTMTDVMIIQRDPQTGVPLRHQYAASAKWGIPDHSTEQREVWNLKDAREVDDVPGAAAAGRRAIPAANMPYSTNLSPTQLSIIASRKVVDYLSSAAVYDLIKSSPEINQPLLYKIMHIRFTQPLVNMIMLLMGIPFLLTREPSRLMRNMVYCILAVGTVFIGTFVMYEMAGTKLDPLLAAWLPVMIFGPASAVMLDVIKT